MRGWMLVAALALVLLVGMAAADTWQSDTGVASGLGDIGDASTPTVFQNDSIWYLISGEFDGIFNGYNWTGSTWQSDSGIVSGLATIEYRPAPTVFQKDGIWHLISGRHDGTFNGYNWTGSTWQSDSGIVSGLATAEYQTAPTVFQKDSIWHLIAGHSEGAFYGYNWTGSTWQSDSGIVSGLGVVGNSAPTVFQKDSIWYLISGDDIGLFNGYNWTGSTWQSDSGIVSGLGDAGSDSKPNVFQKGGIWYLISGNWDGVFYGYNITGASTPIPTSLTYIDGKFWVNHTWDEGTGEVETDSYNVSINGTWHNSTTNTFYNNTLTTYGDRSNITVYAYNNTYGLSDGSVSEDVQLPCPMPAVPAGAGSTWDYYWVNHSWTEGSSYGIWCGDTDSYNVSINGTWHNSTTNTFYNNSPLSSHGWSNASIYAFNDTAGINETYIFQNVQMANRAITITNTSDWSGWEGVNVYVDYDATDPDGDTPTFSCNRTDLFTDFSTSTGKGNWTAVSGTYYVDFGVSDGYGSTNNYTMAITGYSSTPPAPTNLAYSTGCHWVNHTWQAGSGTVSDSYNVLINSVWHNGTANVYYNETGMPPIGWSNISVYAFNNSQGTISDTNVSQNVQIPRCPSLCSFTFYDPFHYYGVHHSKVAGEGGWLPCDYNWYAYSTYGVNFYSTGAEDNVVYGNWDPLVQNYTSCYHGIDATEDCEIIYLHADILLTTTHDSARVYVGEPFYNDINPSNPTHEIIGFQFSTHLGHTLIQLLGTPGTYPDIVQARPSEWVSVSLAYDLTTKKYIYLEAIDSETTYTLHDVSTTYTTQTREISNVTMHFGSDSGPTGYGGMCYVDNVYVSSLEYAPSSTHIVLKDASGNLITNSQVSIYNTAIDTYTQKWENEADGVITISSGASVEALVSVRTFDGVFTQHFSANDSGGVVNWTIPIKYNLNIHPKDQRTIPIKYNLNIHPKDQTGNPMFDVFAGLAEYTPLNPGAFWGMDLSDRGYVPVTNCSGFAMCDIIAEKEGYADYKVEALNWTSKSALVKDYRHNIVMEEE
jgi:hypothetical protein